MPLETHLFDGARFISDREAEVEFVRDALETGDQGHLAHVLGLIARSRGVASMAAELGVTRDAIFDALDGQRDSAALHALAEEFLSRVDAQNTAAE